MSNRIQGERVFCFQCENEWDRAHGGLQCPRCQSEFVEILDPGSRPPLDDPPVIASPPPRTELSRSPFHDHDPWGVPDPDEDDITSFDFNNRHGGTGNFSFSSRTYTFGGSRNNAQQDPATEELSRNFEAMFNNIMGPQGRTRGGTRVYGGTFTFGPRSGGFQHETFSQPLGLPQDLFSMVFETTNLQGRNRGGPAMAPNPFDFLQAIFNPANARSGDAVFSQEAFDRVMSQLMEQNNTNGAPPASEDLIRRLPRKRVDKQMMGNDGTAECSICMDGVAEGTEVAVLPCTHWFHFDCIESWLKEHDTCPHCRKPITPDNETSQQDSASRRRRRSSRRSSSFANPASPMLAGIREDTQSIPNEPGQTVRQARERYYSSRRDSDLQRPSNSRHGSTRSSASRDGAGGGGSGVGGWIRSHMPGF